MIRTTFILYFVILPMHIDIHNSKGFVVSIIWIMLQLPYSFSCEAQTLAYKTLSMENGLPSNVVHYILQDSKGYVWFGTQNGVCRWDSKDFQYFTIESGLPNNEVLYIYEDDEGRIWFSCFSKELCYYYKGHIYNKKNTPFLNKLEIYPGTKLMEANNELYFFSSKNKFSKYSYAHDTVHSGVHDASPFFYLMKHHNRVFTIDYRKRNQSKFSSIEEDTFSLNGFFQPNYPHINRITRVDYTKKKYYFQNGLDSPFYSASYLSNDFQWSLFNDGNILEIYKRWILFKGTHYRINVSYSGFPSLFLIKKMFFFATTNSIIYCNQIPVLAYNNATETIGNSRFLFKYKNNIFSINYKLEIVDVRTGKAINKFDNQILNAYSFNTYNSKYYLTTTSKIYHFSNPYLSISGLKRTDANNFKDITKSKQADVYFSANGYNGAFVNDFKKGNAKRIDNSNNNIYSIFEDHNNRLWYASLNKVYYSDRYSDKIQSYKEFILDEKVPLYCRHFAEDKWGNIFFVTNGGIFIYDGYQKYKIDKTNFLTDNECNKILIDSVSNSFWVATKKGLNHISYKKGNGTLCFEVINKFLQSDGLYSNAINDILLDSNKLYIATENGVNVLMDLAYKPAVQTIPVYLRLSQLNGVDYSKNETLQDLQLKYNQNNLTLSFSALYFTRRDRLKVISYLSRDNQLVSKTEITGNKIAYASLNDGNYRLELHVYDQDYPYIQGRSLMYRFNIHPPYYKTWWFILGAGLFIAILSTSIIWWSVSRRRQQALYQAELKAKLNESNLKSLQSQMNPHFVFNSLNTLQYFITSKNEEGALDYLADFSALIREILEQSVNTMISLESEILFLKKYIQLEILRFRNSFKVLWDVMIDEEDMTDIYIPTMLIQPVLENAVKHGISNLSDYQGEIYISFTLKHHNLLHVIVKNAINPQVNKINRGSAIAVKTINDRLSIYSKSGAKGEYHLSVKNTEAIATITIPI